MGFNYPEENSAEAQPPATGSFTVSRFWSFWIAHAQLPVGYKFPLLVVDLYRNEAGIVERGARLSSTEEIVDAVCHSRAHDLIVTPVA